MERRSVARVPTNLRAIGRVPATPQTVSVLDLSTTGCKAVLSTHAVPGSTIHVDLQPGIVVSGMVVWSSGQHVGIRFQRRLTTAQAITLGIQMGPATPRRINHATPQARGGLQHWVRTIFGLRAKKRK